MAYTRCSHNQSAAANYDSRHSHPACSTCNLTMWRQCWVQRAAPPNTACDVGAGCLCK
jgi:hypothetical protein